MSTGGPSSNSSTALPEETMRNPAFAATRWSVVLSAGGSDTPGARDALSRLCQMYWYPLYAYVRGGAYSREDAQDLTQEFFARLLEHNWVGRADREKGRFRSFLLTAMKRFLADEWDKVRAQKRGGGVPPCRCNSTRRKPRYGTNRRDDVHPGAGL